MLYKNKKTNEIVRLLASAAETSNGKNSMVIVYCPDDDEHTIYTKAEKEFYDEFANFIPCPINLQKLKDFHEWMETEEFNELSIYNRSMYKEALDRMEAFINEKTGSN